LIGFLPTGAYFPLAVLRIFVGFGLAAAITPALTIIVEQTPTRWRSGLTSLFVMTASLGLLLASFTGHALLRALGWRGVAMFGMVSILVGMLVWLFLPESVRWLVAKGRFVEARAAVAKHFGMPVDGLPLPAAPPTAQPRASLVELYANPRLFWQTILVWGGSTTASFGYLLWGPTIIALVLHASVPQAAKYFIYVTLCAIAGRLVVAAVAQKIGRRVVGIVCGFAAVIFLGFAGFFNAMVIGGFPLFVILVAASAFFVDGGLGQSVAPYGRAIWGEAGRARLGTGPRRGRRRQDPWAARAGADRRHRQPRLAPRDAAGGVPGLPVPGLLHAAGRVCVPVPGARDARPGDGARRRRRAGAAAAHRGRALSEVQRRPSRHTPMRRAFLAQ
jgi:MFS transporter, putative metabolite:H+ symporter